MVAKKQANTNKGKLETVALAVLPFTVKVRESTVTDQTGTVEGDSYAIQYGYRQTLQDSIAGVIAGVTQSAKKAANNWPWDKIVDMAKDWGLVPNLPETISDTDGLKAFANLLADTIVADRLSDVLAGKVQTRSVGPRLKGIDAVMRDICDEKIAAEAARRQRKVPTGDALQNLRGVFLAKQGDAIKAEAERRMALLESEAETVTDDDDWAEETPEPEANKAA